MTTERRKNELNMHFFKRPLRRLDSYYILVFNESAMAICWEDGEYWRASLIGSQTNGAIVSTLGRTPREALRKLEKKTLKAVKAFVSTFALVFREMGAHFKKSISAK